MSPHVIYLGSGFLEGKIVVNLLNKLFVKQVNSCHILLDLDPFIFQYSLHNTKYIKSTSLQDISIKVRQLSHSLFPS